MHEAAPSSGAVIDYDLKQARSHLYVAEDSAEEVAQEVGSAPGASDEALLAAYVAESATHRARVLLPDGSEAQGYQQAFERLQQAAQRHRETIQRLAVILPSPEREEAIEEARHALMETQAAMIAIGEHLS